MLKGQVQHGLDAKGRLILPARFREDLGSSFCLTKGFENCLYIYPMEEWEAFSAKLEALPPFSNKARRLKRHFIGCSEDIELDKQGRFLIPQPLRAYAKIEKDVTIIGMMDHVEIWSSLYYQDYEEEEEESISDIAEDLVSWGE